MNVRQRILNHGKYICKVCKRRVIDADDAINIPSKPKTLEYAHKSCYKKLEGTMKQREEEDEKDMDETPRKKMSDTKKSGTKKMSTKKKNDDDDDEKSSKRSTISGDSTIVVLAEENPKRGEAAKRFKLYKKGMTVDEYVEAGGFRADIKWDVEKGFIKVRS